AKRLGFDPGKIIRGRQVNDGPFSESKEVFGGFYLIEAASYDEAVERAMDHPHLEYGGSIEVRETYSCASVPSPGRADGFPFRPVAGTCAPRFRRRCRAGGDGARA